jgi:hypothetical protein
VDSNRRGLEDILRVYFTLRIQCNVVKLMDSPEIEHFIKDKDAARLVKASRRYKQAAGGKLITRKGQ